MAHKSKGERRRSVTCSADRENEVSKISIISQCASGGRRGGLMVSALDPGASGPGSSPGRGHCVVFFGKTFNSHSASLQLTSCGEVTCDGLASRPSRFML